MFSEICDTVAKRTGRPTPSDALNIQSYTRATMRELHALATFAKDRVEEQITPTALPVIWTYPVRVKYLEAVGYGNGIFPKYLLPGEKIMGERYYFYPASNYYVFVGAFLNVPISISYFTRPQVFQYYAEGTRPAVYNEYDETWMYLVDPGPPAIYAPTLGTPEQDEAARDLVANWLMINWRHVVEEGVITKTYKNFGDERSRSSFSLFNDFKKNLLREEDQITQVPDAQV